MEKEVEIWPERTATPKVTAFVSGNSSSQSGFGGARSGVLLDAGVDLVAHEAGDKFPDFGIVEKADHLIAIAVHAANDDFFELAVEDVGEVVDGVGFAGVAYGFVGGGHVAFVGIDGEMDEGAFLECEQGLSVIAVAVLMGQSGYSYPIPKTGIGSRKK